MPGNATTTANPQTSYGSSAVSNRVRPGGGLGTKQYWYKTDAKTGEVSVYRYSKVGRASASNIKIGSIPQGGNFNVESKSNGDPVANTSEILHYSDKNNISKVRTQALKTARKEWDGKTQPPPNTAIYGNNAINTAYGKTNNKTSEIYGSDNIQKTQDELDNDARKTSLGSNQRAKQAPNTSLGAGKLLIYPKAIRGRGHAAQDRIKIQMLQYIPKPIEFTGTDLSGGGSRPKNRKGLGAVLLPIPGGITDTNTVSWGPDSMNPVEMAATMALTTAFIDGLSPAAQRVAKLFNDMKANKQAVKGALGTALAASAGGLGASVVKRTEGAIVNPNMELLFNSPQLRQFTFNWKLAPRSQDEAMEVIKIIRFFKQGMSPIREAPNLFLKAPNTFKLTYLHKDQGEHKYLNKFKECALMNFQTQYTPEGNYATFEDGVMTAYQISLSFQELEPVYSTDYEKVGNDEIGF